MRMVGLLTGDLLENRRSRKGDREMRTGCEQTTVRMTNNESLHCEALWAGVEFRVREWESLLQIWQT